MVTDVFETDVFVKKKFDTLKLFTCMYKPSRHT